MTQSVPGVRRIAFFGGSFDPPHFGHLAVARAARAALSLDTILFAPVGAQPLKPDGSTASFEDRVKMTRLAIDGEPGFALSLADAPRPAGEPNYTLDTLMRLRAELPQESRLYCLMGADSFGQLRLWHRGEEVPFAAHLIVASRPGLPLDDLRAMLPQGLTLQPASEGETGEPQAEQSGIGSTIALCRYAVANEAGLRAPFYLLPGLDVEISASQIREWIRARTESSATSKAADETLMPEAVAEYIRLRGLYH